MQHSLVNLTIRAPDRSRRERLSDTAGNILGTGQPAAMRGITSNCTQQLTLYRIGIGADLVLLQSLAHKVAHVFGVTAGRADHDGAAVQNCLRARHIEVIAMSRSQEQVRPA